MLSAFRKLYEAPIPFFQNGQRNHMLSTAHFRSFIPSHSMDSTIVPPCRALLVPRPLIVRMRAILAVEGAVAVFRPLVDKQARDTARETTKPVILATALIGTILAAERPGSTVVGASVALHQERGRRLHWCGDGQDGQGGESKKLEQMHRQAESNREVVPCPRIHYT